MVDQFWKYFWIGSGGLTVVGLLVASTLFVSHTQQGDLLAAIGVTYEDGKDPFQNGILGGFGGGPVSLSSGYLYQNSLPLYFKSWTWSAVEDWRSAEQKKEGMYALKGTFAEAGGTIGMNGPEINMKDMQSITFSVYVDSLVSDLYINLYDKNGTAFAQQSVGWYTGSGMLTPNTWVDVTIPLKNFGGGTLITSLSGFSISSKNPGIAYVDAVQLSKNNAEHSIWVAPPDTSGQPFNPFATSTPASLPYQFSPAPDSIARWFSYFGVFGPGKAGEIVAGPSVANKSTGSLTIFRGGRNWGDYSAEAVIDWGEVSVFSLLGRFVDDGNFVSCAFSRYGETAQIYNMKGGTSNFISQTPGLAVKDFEPWKNVRVGIEVRGQHVSCLINGEEVLKANIPEMSHTGSVGFETWDPNYYAAPHTLKSFTVEARSSE